MEISSVLFFSKVSGSAQMMETFPTKQRLQHFEPHWYGEASLWISHDRLLSSLMTDFTFKRWLFVNRFATTVEHSFVPILLHFGAKSVMWAHWAFAKATYHHSWLIFIAIYLSISFLFQYIEEKYQNGLHRMFLTLALELWTETLKDGLEDF